MKTIIYYFSGTGNSLAAARKISSILGECELVPIASLQEGQGDTCPHDVRVGIVCPVYHSHLPRIVAGFAKRLDTSRASYVFAVVTAALGGALAIHQLNGILYRKNGRNLDTASYVLMPGNYPPLIQVPPLYKQPEILKTADERLERIAHAIRRDRARPPAYLPFSSIIHEAAGTLIYHDTRNADRRYRVADTCKGCRTCVQVCPVDNVIMIRDRPSWLHHCESCGACLNFCPEEAIRRDVIQGISGSGRYHHPDVSAEEIIVRKGGLAERGNGFSSELPAHRGGTDDEQRDPDTRQLKISVAR